jgi:D-serine dehydratase
MEERPILDWRTKGLPPRAEGIGPDRLGALGLDLAAGDLMMPAALLLEAPLRRNVAEMQAFADRIGARLCPHGKTTMSPELFAMQMAAGAWGLTAATAHHARIYRRLGLSRILLASQLAAPADLAFLMDELAADPAFDFYCLVDSAAGIDLLAAAAAERGLERPVQLLIETGFEGGRAGVRSVAEALDLARRIRAAAPRLALRGIETFEGIRQTVPDARAEAGEMLDLAIIAASEAAREGLFGDGPVLLTAGGSAFLDLVAAKLPAELSGHKVERVIRPGCYVTHDHGLYARATRPGGVLRDGLPDLEGAIEIWAAVLSLPEPGRAIVGAGKRDLSSDVEPPVPLWHLRPGRESAPRPAEGMTTTSLWDQHAALSVPPGALAIGDLIGFGISHPCAAFDRWRTLFLADDRRRITGAVSTLF